MLNLLADPRCDCPIAQATGLTCRDCPRRRRPAPRKPDEVGLEIPTFLRRSTNQPAPKGRPGGRCCED